MTIETTLTFVPALGKDYSCNNCIGDGCVAVCDALPNCMGNGPDGAEIIDGARGNGIIWVLKQ